MQSVVAHPRREGGVAQLEEISETRVRLVIPTITTGSRRPRTVMIGAAWQRCRVNFMPNVLARVARTNAQVGGRRHPRVFAQPDGAAVAKQFDRITATLSAEFPDVVACWSTPGRTWSPSRPPSSAGCKVVEEPGHAGPSRDQSALQRRRGVPQ